MSIYDDDWGDPQPLATTRRNTFVAPDPRPAPVQAYPIPDAPGELVTGLMAEARTVHVADPITRGKSMLLKTSGVTVALAILTAAAMLMLDGWTFLLWIFLASLEWVICFLVLAHLDWREHPSAVRWEWTQGILGMMEREQEARLRAQYGEDRRK